MAGREIGIQLFDNGLAQLKTLATTGGRITMHLTEDWVKGDSYATITTTKSIASMDLSDTELSDPATIGENRRVTVSEVTIPGGNVTGTVGPTPDLHIALVDNTNSTMLFVTDETSDQQITGGNPVIVPTFTVGFDQVV